MDGSQEEEQLYRYYKAVEEYNKTEVVSGEKKPHKFEKGSLLQKIFDPLATAQKLANGSVFYNLTDKEVQAQLPDEAQLKEEYQKAKTGGEVEVAAEAENELRLALLQEMDQSAFSLDDFNEVLDKEFSVFKKGEKYDYVKDMRNAFSKSLEKSTAQKIFEKIPEHVFWDIKTPQQPDEQKYMNPYNPFRKYPNSNFFDIRETEAFMDRRVRKDNTNDGISLYRRY
jgi:hypothetical protein